MNLSARFKNIKRNDIILRLFTVWCLISCGINLYKYLFTPHFYSLLYTDSISILIFLICFIVLFALLCFINKKFADIHIDDKLFFISISLYSIIIASVSSGIYSYLGVACALAITYKYLLDRNYLSLDKIRINTLTSIIVIGAIAFFAVFIIARIGFLRYKTFSTPNFDFGIFSQMYHKMAHGFTPLTTCERDGLLSHFKIHMSPILYSILPVYMVFPSPVTLQILQGFIAVSGVIPLFFLCRHFNISNKFIVFICCIYCLYPVLSMSNFYDFHENVFLAPLLLFTFLFFEKNKFIPTAVFAFLVCTVKEDAPIYIAFFALFIIFARKKYKQGFILLIISVIYFTCAVTYLSKYGNGIMDTRYSNYIVGNSGLIGMIKTVIVSPGHVFTQIFSSNEGDGFSVSKKITYLLFMLLPLGFLPVMTKKISRLILLLPMVLINLMTMYAYQFDPKIHYNFGSLAFLFYISVINVSEMKLSLKRYVTSFAMIMTVVIYSGEVYKSYDAFNSEYAYNKENYDTMEKALLDIPSDASVIASSMLVPHLSEHDILYEDFYTSKSADYVVIDNRDQAKAHCVEYSNKYLAMSYDIYKEYDNLLVILKKNK